MRLQLMGRVLLLHLWARHLSALHLGSRPLPLLALVQLCLLALLSLVVPLAKWEVLESAASPLLVARVLQLAPLQPMVAAAVRTVALLV